MCRRDSAAGRVRATSSLGQSGGGDRTGETGGGDEISSRDRTARRSRSVTTGGGGAVHVHVRLGGGPSVAPGRRDLWLAGQHLLSSGGVTQRSAERAGVPAPLRRLAGINRWTDTAEWSRARVGHIQQADALVIDPSARRWPSWRRSPVCSRPRPQPQSVRPSVRNTTYTTRRRLPPWLLNPHTMAIGNRAPWRRGRSTSLTSLRTSAGTRSGQRLRCCRRRHRILRLLEPVLVEQGPRPRDP